MAAFHGGAFWRDYGERFERFSTSGAIPADVLDAWYPPAPGVIDAIELELPRLARTSPPAHADGLVEQISLSRLVPRDSIAVGAGSSALMYLALPRFLAPGDAMLVYDPIYGEYPHLGEKLGCRVIRASGLGRFALGLEAKPRVAVLVNPVNPTGEYLDPAAVFELVSAFPETLFWVDEAYLEYVPRARSLEASVASCSNLIVCKSLSKVYALSGLRVAYLVAYPSLAAEIRAWTPPWAVGTVAQLAAIKALEDPCYYAGRYAETREFRTLLASGIDFGTVYCGHLNAVMVELPAPAAPQVVETARAQGVYVRNVSSMSASFGDRFIRVAVRPEVDRLVGVLRDCCCRVLAAEGSSRRHTLA